MDLMSKGNGSLYEVGRCQVAICDGMLTKVSFPCGSGCEEGAKRRGGERGGNTGQSSSSLGSKHSRKKAISHLEGKAFVG